MRVVLVEPHYAGNIGSVARVMKNFGVSELYLVNPLADPFSAEARRYAMGGRDVLFSARVVDTLEEALEGVDTRVGTTGIPNDKYARRTPITPKELKDIPSRKMALVFGREPSGLTNEELSLMDIIVTIPANPEYPSLNLSHAVAIILYELYNSSPPEEVELRSLDHPLKRMVALSDRRDPEEVLRIWKAVIRRGIRTRKELGAVRGVIEKLIKCCER